MLARAAALLLSSAAAASAASLPNIVMVMTDDQDVELGGSSAEVMPRLHALLAAGGATADKMYVHVPVCCPSRSSFHSGQYQHNNQVRGNSIGSNCSSLSWQAGPEARSVATYLRAAGYATHFAGKYLNDYGNPAVGGVAHVPAGWMNWQGLVGNSVYYHYTLSNNGVAEAHGDDPGEDYLPSVILNKSLAFIDEHKAGQAPLFMVLSTPSCHGPQESLPKYQTAFAGKGAPRTPAFHAELGDSHWLQATEGGGYGLNASSSSSGANSAAFSDLVFRRRWQTLQSVDDILDAVVAKMDAIGQLDNTFFVYTTDNGYHMGQFGLIYDKRQPWETDVHLPLFVRGPGVKAGSTLSSLVSMPDLSATLLDIAGVPPPPHFDGSSILPALRGEPPAAGAERIAVLVEYTGETADGGGGGACSQTRGTNLFCNPDGNYTVPPFFYGEPLCVCQDAANNTYSCLRVRTAAANYRYCEFADDVGTVEYMDELADPFELTNRASALAPAVKAALHTRLAAVHACAGAAQCDPLLATPISVRLADGTDFEVVDPLAFEAELAAAARGARAANS